MIYIKYSILCVLVIIIGIMDYKTMKISNKVLLLGAAVAILFNTFLIPITYKQMIALLISEVFLFFFGMLRLMGLGDLKLWMMITLYTGMAKSCIIIVIAAFVLVVSHLYDRKAQRISIITINQIMMKQKMVVMDQKKYAFAPYIAFGAICISIYTLFVNRG